MPTASNQYDSNGKLITTLPRREIPMPEPPKFDLRVRRENRLPVGGAAIRSAGAAPAPPPSESHGPAVPAHTGVDTFHVPIGTGIQSSGMAMQAWSPGMPFTPGLAPVYTGNWSSNILNVKPEKAEIQAREGDLAAAKSGVTQADKDKEDHTKFRIASGYIPQK